MKIVPYEYQIESLQDVEDFDGRALLALEMGLGKTLVALMYLQKHPECLPAIVVCPAMVKYMWEFEILRHLNIQPAVAEGRTPPKAKIIQKMIVINFDIMHWWVDKLAEMKPKTIIIDEAHFCKDRYTKRTKAVKAVSKKCNHVVALTGTPLVNRPSDLWPTLNIVRPDVFKSFWEFAQSFCSPEYTPWGWDYSGAVNLPKLHKLLNRTCMIRRLKKDVLKDLPPKSRRVVLLGMTAPDMYRDAERDFIRWLSTNDITKVSSARKAEELVKMGYLRRLAAQLKLPFLLEWINQFLEETDEKLVVFAIHKGMVKELKEGSKCTSVVVDGDVTGRDRHLAVEKFTRDPNTRLFIGNIQAAGIGITLTVSSTAVIAELPWRPSDVIQAEDRIHRISQGKPSTIFYALAGGTIEEAIAEVLQEKEQISRAVLDGRIPEDSLDVFNLVRERLRNEIR